MVINDGPPPRDQWSKDVEHNVTSMRDAGRWLIGVVAGLVLAATNLSGLGRLNPSQWRFWFAAISAAIAIVCIGYIIRLFLEIQVGSDWGWEDLGDEDFKMAQRFGFLVTYSSFQDFNERYAETLKEYEKVRNSIGTTELLTPAQYNRDKLLRQQELSDQLTNFSWEQRNVQSLISWRPMRDRYIRAKHALFTVGAIAAVAALCLVWAVNGPNDETTIIVSAPATVIASPQASPIP